MLEKLLAEIKNGGTLQPAALAARLNVSVGLVQVMIEDLERRGLLTAVKADCDQPCGGCHLADSCGIVGHNQGKLWHLKVQSERYS